MRFVHALIHCLICNCKQKICPQQELKELELWIFRDEYVGTWRWTRTNLRSQTTNQKEDTKHLMRFDRLAYVPGQNRERFIDDLQLLQKGRVISLFFIIQDNEHTFLFIHKRRRQNHNRLGSQHSPNTTTGRSGSRPAQTPRSLLNLREWGGRPIGIPHALLWWGWSTVRSTNWHPPLSIKS